MDTVIKTMDDIAHCSTQRIGTITTLQLTISLRRISRAECGGSDESGRAGESGFAVVAGEVRHLPAAER